jgi:hypothetical protein
VLISSQWTKEVNGNVLSANAVIGFRIVQLNFKNICISRYVLSFVVVLHFWKENLIQLKICLSWTTKPNFNHLEPSGLSRPVMGLLYFYKYWLNPSRAISYGITFTLILDVLNNYIHPQPTDVYIYIYIYMELLVISEILTTCIYWPTFGNAKCVSLYLLHSFSTLNQCRELSCGTFVCKYFASFQEYPNYKWDLIW